MLFRSFVKPKNASGQGRRNVSRNIILHHIHVHKCYNMCSLRLCLRILQYTLQKLMMRTCSDDNLAQYRKKHQCMDITNLLYISYVYFELHSRTKLFICQRLRPLIVSTLARCNDAIFLLRAIRMISMKVWYLTTSSLPPFPGSVPANCTMHTH